MLKKDGVKPGCKRPHKRPFAWDRFRGSADLPNDYDLAILQILEGDTDTYLLVLPPAPFEVAVELKLSSLVASFIGIMMLERETAFILADLGKVLAGNDPPPRIEVGSGEKPEGLIQAFVVSKEIPLDLRTPGKSKLNVIREFVLDTLDRIFDRRWFLLARLVVVGHTHAPF
jgi:hypothetical protein